MGVAQVTAIKKIRHTLESLAQKHLAATFSRFSSVAQQALQGMSESASSSRLQVLFFDAQRLLRVDGGSIEAATVKYVHQQLSVQFQPKVAAPMHGHQGESGEQPLELMGDEELELVIALDNCAAEAKARAAKSVTQLRRCCAALGLGDRDGAPYPLSPDQFLESFAKSLESRGLALEVKLVLLKAFHHCCFDDSYSPALDQAVKAFQQAGISPDTPKKRPVKTRPARAVVTNPESIETDSSASLMDSAPLVEGPSSTSGAPTRIQSATMKKLSAIVGGYQPANADSSDQWYSNDQLLEKIDQIIEDLRLDTGRNMGSQELREQFASGKRKLQEDADNMVSLVGKTFSHYRQQSMTPPEVQQVLGRCELPLLKLAMQKPAVLDQKNHPVRRLFNEMANYAIGLEEGSCEDTETYRQILRLSEQMLDSEFDDREVPRMLSEFTSAMQRERKRSDAHARRVLEEIAAREKINWAHTRVDDELVARLKKKPVPELVREFAETCWSKVLYMAHLRYGEGSSPWQDGLALFDMLIDFSGRSCEELDREAVTALFESIEQRLKHISFDAKKQSGMMEALRSLLLPSEESSLEDVLTEDIKRMLIEKIAADLPGKNIREEVESAETLDDELSHQLSSVKRGRWVRLDGDAGKECRGRLSGIVGPSWKYVFVNNRGDLVAERSRSRLAVELLDGKVAVLDNSHLFDRALSEAFREIKGRSAAG